MTNGRDIQPTERDGLELSDVERDHGSSQPTAYHPTLVEDKGKVFFFCFVYGKVNVFEFSGVASNFCYGGSVQSRPVANQEQTQATGKN